MTQGFNPAKPAFQTPITSLELRTQFNSLATHHEGASAPLNVQLGWTWLDTSNPVDRILKMFNGTSWIPIIGLDSPGLIVKLLSHLLDVQIVAPANNDVLTYEFATSKWKNLPATGGGSNLVMKQEPRTITGLNTIQSLSLTPADDTAVQIFINGNLAEIGIDYTVVGTTVTWISPTVNIDVPDKCVAVYPTIIVGVNIEQETLPVLGINSILPLSQTPANANNVQLYVNGNLTENGVDYTLSGTIITWISGLYNIALTDKVIAYYLY